MDRLKFGNIKEPTYLLASLITAQSGITTIHERNVEGMKSKLKFYKGNYLNNQF